MRRLENLKYGLMKHLSDATSVSALSVPIKAITDQLAGMSDMNSMEARAKMIGWNYLGLVQLLRLRDWSKKKLGISNSKNKALHYVHDAGFILGVSVPIQIGVYASSGVDDWKKMAVTIGGSMAVTSVIGGPMGQFIDTYRELMRVKKSRNTPAYFKRIKNKYKKKVGVGLVAGLLTLGGGLYHFIPNRAPEVRQVESSIEKMLDGGGVTEGCVEYNNF